MRFFSDRSGKLWPAAAIKYVSSEKHGEAVIHCAYFEDETYVQLGPGEFENLREQDAPFLSCADGYFILDLDFGNGTNDPVIRTPVVGWCLSPERGTLPVTLGGVNDGRDSSLPVLFPNGQVQISFNCIYDSLDQFVSQNSPEGADHG